MGFSQLDHFQFVVQECMVAGPWAKDEEDYWEEKEAEEDETDEEAKDE